MAENTKDRRAVYDAQIAPLIAQIEAIASPAGISFVAAFQVSDDGCMYSINLLQNAHKEMRDLAKWLLIDETKWSQP